MSRQAPYYPPGRKNRSYIDLLQQQEDEQLVVFYCDDCETGEVTRRRLLRFAFKRHQEHFECLGTFDKLEIVPMIA